MYSSKRNNRSQGWFSIYRSFLSSDLWLSERFTRGQAWVDLIGLANHKLHGFRTRGIWVTIKRGQLGWSTRELADRWSWSPTMVKRFLLELKREAQIDAQFTNVTTIITIINYDEYQQSEAQNETEKERKQDTEKDQPNTNNNNNNNNNEDKTDAASLAEQSLPLVTMPELALLRKVPGYPFDANKDFGNLTQLSEEFPDIDVVSLLKNWIMFIKDNPFKKKSSPRAQLRNQFVLAMKKGFHKKASGGNGQQPSHTGAGPYDYDKYAEDQARKEGAIDDS